MKQVIKSTVKEIDGLKITIPDSSSGTAYNTTKYHGENFVENDIVDNFVVVKLETKDGKKMQKMMFQPNPLETIESDIKRVENGDIRNTELKNEFTKIMLKKNEIYNLTVNGTDVKGEYIGTNIYNIRQLKFNVDGKTINTDKENIKIEINKNKYDI
jgi:hypothetical protein